MIYEGSSDTEEKIFFALPSYKLLYSFKYIKIETFIFHNITVFIECLIK